MKKTNSLKFESIFSIGRSVESKAPLEKDYSHLDKYFALDFDVNDSDVVNELNELKSKFKRDNAIALFEQQKNRMIDVVVDKFYLGGIVAGYDKVGGNVDTINNVRQGVWATDKEKAKYQNRPDYDSAIYHSHSNYKGKGEADKKLQKNESLIDPYTSSKIPDKKRQRHLDHVISANEIHNDSGRFLAGLDATEKGTELANSLENLKSTHRQINQSKSDSTIIEWTKKLPTEIKAKESKLNKEKEKLSQMPNKTPEEKHNCRVQKSVIEKSEENIRLLKSVDINAMQAIDEEARKKYNKVIHASYYGSFKYAKSVGVESGKEALAMGFRQVVAVFLTETIAGVFDEIKDFIRNGKEASESAWKELKHRISRIIERLKNKWEAALESALQGSISGFMSNVVTVLINIFMTTAKNIVRLIREGFFSIVKAVKYIASPPEGATKEQVSHEVGRIILAGITVAVAIIFEESIDKTPPMLAIRSLPFGETLADIVLGIMTALATGLVMWGWDKLDLFGVSAKKQHEFVMLAIESKNNETIKKHNDWLEAIRLKDPERYEYLKAELSL